QAAGGEPIVLPEPGPKLSRYEPEGAVPLAASRVFLSRTDPHGSPTKTQNCREIFNLYVDAIAAAKQLIYIETQYFSSREVGAALVERLARSDEGPLGVVLVLNMEAETLKEEIAVGLAQAKVIADLRKAVQGTRHRLGIYYTVPKTEDGVEPKRATYIHSKVMIVDDRFLTVGSANLTNRSVGVDTELNLSVETDDSDDVLGQSIARARQGLICEHLGVSDTESLDTTNLVDSLDDLARRHQGRLRLHPSPTENERTALEVIDPQQLPFDPAAIEQEQSRSIFIGGIGALWRRFTSGTPTRNDAPERPAD
ncbi:MAG TPA: phospholipase D-like domain-containing protein, partial [Polyangiaceae bacterium]|nr:phospholipase D-like domain-containing protein [Polyangiaceae bacterium]